MAVLYPDIYIFSRGAVTFYLMGIFVFQTLLLFCRGGEFKIEANIIIEVRLVISIFGYLLKFHVLTSQSAIHSMPWAWDRC